MRRHLTYANVVATLALFMALGGGVVFAASQVTSSDLAKRAVRTKNIADNAVKSPQIKNNEINSGDIRDQNVTGGDIADSTIETSDLKDGSVKGGKVGDESLTGADLQDGTLGQNDLGVPPGKTMKGAIGGSFPVAMDVSGAASLFPDPVVDGPTGFDGPHALNSVGAAPAPTTGFNTAYASFPIPAPANLANADISVNPAPPGADADPASCTGTADAPTAAPGKLCIYVNSAINADTANGVILGNGQTTRYGFRMTWNSTDPAQPTTLDGTWAYTAPNLP